MDCQRPKSVNYEPHKHEPMRSAPPKDVRTYAPSTLLGRPLNDIESKFAPAQLHVAGPMHIPIPRPRVAIVGSRGATSNGLADAGLISGVLVERGVVIVSGLAKGIDTIAHRTAMDMGGQTIAVLGTPLDNAYRQRILNCKRR